MPKVHRIEIFNRNPAMSKDDSQDDHGVLPSFDVVEGEGNSGFKPGRSRCHVLSIRLADQCVKMSFRKGADRGRSRLPNDQSSAVWGVPGRPIGERGKKVKQSW
jgi:hypothetical protein